MDVQAGMLLAARTVASAMSYSAASLVSCSSPPCGVPGIVVTAPTEQIIDVLPSDVACDGVVPTCQAEDDAGCTKYYVLPNAVGNCHIDVDLEKGTRFSTDIDINGGTSSCMGFYPTIAADSNVEVP
jgi:hypothetical protein